MGQYEMCEKEACTCRMRREHMMIVPGAKAGHPQVRFWMPMGLLCSLSTIWKKFVVQTSLFTFCLVT